MILNTVFNRKDRKETQRNTITYMRITSCPEGESAEGCNPLPSFAFFASFAVELRFLG